jgi:hypothetical protein
VSIDDTRHRGENLLAARPTVPEPIKAGILAMVKAVLGGLDDQ